VLSKLLNFEEPCMRVLQRDRIRIMRCLYTMLLWATQRIADRVCARDPVGSA